MIGLIVIGIAIAWVFLCVVFSRWFGRRFQYPVSQFVAAFLTFWVLLVLPVADEIVGGFQFRALCAEGAVITLGVKNPAGRTTRYSGAPIDEVVPGTAIPILHSHIEYHDVLTNELVAKHERYVAQGGVLVRSLGISENNSPLTIGAPFCSGERGVSLPRLLKFKVVN